MNCEDLMNIPGLRDGMRLVAGRKGLSRNIRWIYFADCSQCLKDEVDLRDLIHGEELVIVTNESLTGDDEKIIEMIRVMLSKDIAGFVINEGQISQPVADYCDAVNLPLYELFVTLHLVDVSQIICSQLVEEENRNASRERLLASILYAESVQAREIYRQANYLGIDLTKSSRIGILRMFLPEEAEGSVRPDEGDFLEMCETLKKNVETGFRSCGLRHVMVLSQGRDIIFLLPAGNPDKEELSDILQNLIRRNEAGYHVTITAGIGTAYPYPEDLKKSYQEAKRSLTISSFAQNASRIYFYEDQGIYSLVAEIPDGKFLDGFMEKRIGRLIEADKVQEGKLCETLEAYLEHNCSANDTAEALYIHRNTLRYRLDKIQKILDIDSIALPEAIELQLAFAIQKYRAHRGGLSVVHDAQESL